MLEYEAIKSAICCFSSQSSHLTSSFTLITKAISARLLPCTILNYTFIPLLRIASQRPSFPLALHPPPPPHPQPAQSPAGLPLCDWLGKHIWAESWQLSSFISATCPSVSQRLGGGSAKGKTRQQGKTTGHCHVWWVSLWGCVQQRKNSPSDNFPRRLHTVQLMLHVWLIVWKKEVKWCQPARRSKGEVGGSTWWEVSWAVQWAASCKRTYGWT